MTVADALDIYHADRKVALVRRAAVALRSRPRPHRLDRLRGPLAAYHYSIQRHHPLTLR